MGGNIWMDLIGLAAGHIYYFLKEVVPAEYGYTLIKTPHFLLNFMYKAVQPRAPPAGGPAPGGPARVAGVGGGGGGGGGGGAPPPPPPAQANFGGTGHRLGGT